MKRQKLYEYQAATVTPSIVYSIIKFYESILFFSEFQFFSHNLSYAMMIPPQACSMSLDMKKGTPKKRVNRKIQMCVLTIDK